MMEPRDQALVELGRVLRGLGYFFITPTPETHRRVNARPDNQEARDLRGVFGWSRRFRPEAIPAAILALVERAGMLVSEGAFLRSQVRFASLGEHLFLHSAFPTSAADAVFFGPDTYRFAALLDRRVTSAGRVVDVGCGSGAGGLVLAKRAASVVLADINPAALRFSAVNAALAGAAAVTLCESDVLAGVSGAFDLVVANPPYLVDDRHRTYRDGGGTLGITLSLRIADESLARLGPGGRLLLYTATPILDGRDPLREALAPILHGHGARATYEELDPDVFGEELERPAYAAADRIAVVALDAILSNRA